LISGFILFLKGNDVFVSCKKVCKRPANKQIKRIGENDDESD